MLNRTQATAGMSGSKRATPRLSPSARSAICWAAKAASPELSVEKIAPAMAVPAREDLSGIGRLGREMSLVGFEGRSGILLGVKHLALRIAMVAIVAAIEGKLKNWCVMD